MWLDRHVPSVTSNDVIPQQWTEYLVIVGQSLVPPSQSSRACTLVIKLLSKAASQQSAIYRSVNVESCRSCILSFRQVNVVGRQNKELQKTPWHPHFAPSTATTVNCNSTLVNITLIVLAEATSWINTVASIGHTCKAVVTNMIRLRHDYDTTISLRLCYECRTTVVRQMAVNINFITNFITVITMFMCHTKYCP